MCWQVDDLKVKLAAQEANLKQKNKDADKLIQARALTVKYICFLIYHAFTMVQPCVKFKLLIYLSCALYQIWRG